jgi:predicted DNA binding CopG/RHH family protein
MKKELIRVSVESKDFQKLEQRASSLGVSVPTYSRIVLKKAVNE